MNGKSYPIEIVCCFTGHRPKKLNADEQTVKAALALKIEEAIADGYSVFISGMAHGVDLWAAEAVLEAKAAHPEIKLLCAFPFLKKRFDSEEESVKERADEVTFISGQYHRTCFALRDRWMVDHSSRVIAVFNGSEGGTAKTIGYARATGRDVITSTCG